IRSRMFANIHAFSRVASRFASIANWSMTQPVFRRGLERIAGIDARRKLPHFASQTFESWFRGRTSGIQTSHATSGKVVLFHDAFINFNYPEIGIAATQLLEAAGYNVELSERACCGRPMISKGFPDLARESAEFNIARLHQFVERGYSIVGL